MNSTVRKTINHFLILSTVTCAFFTVGYYILHVNKGYNLLDEGFFLLSSANPTDVKQQLTSFNFYLHFLMHFNSNIIFLRLFSLVIHLISLGLLSCAFARLLTLNTINKRVIILLTACAMVTVYGLNLMFPTELNYNSFTLIGAVFFYSIMIFLLTSPTERYTNLYSFMLGFIAVFIFFNKFTSGLLLILLSFFAYILICIKNKNFAKQALLFLMLGFLSQLIIYFSLIQNLHDFFTAYKNGFQSLKIMPSNHSLALLAENYQQTKELIAFSYGKYKLIFYLLILNSLTEQLFTLLKRWHNYRLFSWDVLINRYLNYGVLLLFFYLSYKIDKNWSIGRYKELASFYFSAMILMLLVMLANLSWQNWRAFLAIEKHKVLPLVLLILFLILPLIIAIGTNNIIYVQILLSCFVWMPVIVFLAYDISKKLGRMFIYLTIAGISVFSTYQALFNMHEFPYGLYGNLPAQKYLTDVNNTKLYVDSTTKFIIENTRAQLKKCGFKPNDYLVSLTDLPGLTYAVKARSPSCPWYFGLYKDSDQFIKFCLNLSPEIKPTYLLLDSYQGQWPLFSANQLGAIFKNYTLCGEVKNIPTEGGVCCKARVNNIKLFKLNALV